MNHTQRFFFLVSLLALLSSNLFSVVVTIGTGTDPFHYPFNDWYTYSRSQSLYKATELTSGSGFITSLGWYYNHIGAQTNAIGTTEIWLKNTTGTALTGADWESEGTLVATISNLTWTSPSRWIDIPITTFFYDGGALLVSVRTQNGNNATPNATWLYSGYSGQQLMRAGESNTANPPVTALVANNRPNLRMEIAPSDGNPVAPSLISPTDAATGVTYNPGPSLNWTNGAYTDYVQVYMNTNQSLVSSNNSGALVFSGSAATYSTGILPVNTLYYWRIAAYNNLTGGTSNSPVWSFLTAGQPDPPTLIYPANEATNIRYTGTSLHWSMGAYTNNVDIYLSPDQSLVINKDTSVRVVWGGPGTYFAMGLLSPETTYYWRGVARNSALNLTTDSPVWSFTTDGPPAVPNPVFPPDAATGVPFSGSQLSWTTGNFTNNVDLYFSADQNLVDTNSSSALVVNAQNVSSYELGTLLQATTYYWKVIARNTNANVTTAGPVRSFTTNGIPEAPTLVSPLNAATDVAYDTCLLSWTTGMFTVNVDVFFGTNSTLVSNKDASVRVASAITDTSFEPGILNQVATYYWKVVARNNDGTATTDSPLMSFSTNGTPAMPALVYPANAALNIPFTGSSLSWTNGSFTDNVDVYFTTDGNLINYSPPSIRVITAQNVTSYEPGTLSDNTTYFWKVVARNATAGVTTSSATYHFTTDGHAGLPTDYSPANAASLSGVNPVTLAWTNGVYTAFVDVYLSSNQTDVTNLETAARVVTHENVQTYSPGILNQGTTYYWKVVPYSVSGNIANTAAPVRNFSTTLFSLAEDFETSTGLPPNWTSVEGVYSGVYAHAAWTRILASESASPVAPAQNGTAMLKLNSLDGFFSSARLTAPVIDFSSGTHKYMVFWMYHTTVVSQLGGDDGIQPQISFNNTNWALLGSGFPRQASVEGWAQHVINLSAYAGHAQIWVSLMGTTGHVANFYIDNVHFIDDSTPFTTISQASLNFGSVRMNQSADQNFTITNLTSSTMTGTITAPAGFAVSLPGINDTPQNSVTYSTAASSLTVQITFLPTVDIVYSGQVAINSNDVANPLLNVPVSGTGLFSTSLISESFEGSTILPAYWSSQEVTYYSGTHPQWSVVGNGTNPPCLPFAGTQMVKFNSFTTYTTQKARLRLPSLYLNSDCRILSFRMYHETSGIFNSAIINNEGLQVQISLNGTDWTNLSAFIPRPSSTTGWQEYHYDLSSYVGNENVYLGLLGFSSHSADIYVDNIIVSDALPPFMSIDVRSLDYTPVAVGKSLTRSLVITNSGYSPLSCDFTPSDLLTFDFEIRGSSAGRTTYGLNIEALSSMAVNVSFNPIEVQDYSTELVFQSSNDPLHPSITIPISAKAVTNQTSVTESFEGAVFPPDGWTNQSLYLNSMWGRTVSGNHPWASSPLDTYMLSFNNFDIPTGGSARMISRPIDCSSGVRHLSFLMYHESGMSFAISEGVQVQVSTDGQTWTNLGAYIQRYVPGMSYWAYHTFNLADYIGQPTVYLGLLVSSYYGYNVYLDNFRITDTPPVAVPLPITSDIVNNSYFRPSATNPLPEAFLVNIYSAPDPTAPFPEGWTLIYQIPPFMLPEFSFSIVPEGRYFYRLVALLP